MKTASINIGLEVDCSEVLFRETVKTWQRSIIPAIEKVATEFEQLQIGHFSNKIYTAVIESGIGKVKALYTDHLQTQIKKSKTEFLSQTVLAGIPEQIKPLDIAIKALQEAFKQPHALGIGVLYHLYFEPNDIQIIDSLPVLQVEQVRNRYCTYIETEAEAEGYELMMAVKEATDQFAAFLKLKGYPVGHRAVYDADGFFSEVQGEGNLNLNFDQLKTIYRYEQRTAETNN